MSVLYSQGNKILYLWTRSLVFKLVHIRSGVRMIMVLNGLVWGSVGSLTICFDPVKEEDTNWIREENEDEL